MAKSTKGKQQQNLYNQHAHFSRVTLHVNGLHCLTKDCLKRFKNEIWIEGARGAKDTTTTWPTELTIIGS